MFVSAVVDYTNTTMATRTLAANCKGTIQLKKYLGVFTVSNICTINSIFVDYADSQMLNYASKYLCENKIVREAVSAC